MSAHSADRPGPSAGAAGLSRRAVLAGAIGAFAGTGLTVRGAAGGVRKSAAGEVAEEVADEHVQENPTMPRICLNTSTLRGQKLKLEELVEIAADAGYDGIEPWISEIEDYRNRGGDPERLRGRIEDLGLRVESAIGFARWIVDDPQERRQALEVARRDMEAVASIGGTRIAAPPAGATDRTDMALADIAARYRDLLELGVETGVVPQLELWGFSKTLSRLGELMYVLAEAGHRDACVLPDVYHIYKGGSSFEGLRAIAGDRMHCFHVNDYPADPPRERISDADRVLPGEGVAPLDAILGILLGNGFDGALSLELFNPKLWERDPREVATAGREAVATALKSALSQG